MTESVSLWRRFDYVLFGTSMILIVFGILMIRSATLDAIDPDIISRVPDQITFAIISVFAVFTFAAIDYKLLGGLHSWLYALMIIMLLMVLAVGVEGDAGARRWINVGIRIQPSEIGKIIVIITLAQFFAQRYLELNKLTTVFKSLIHVGVPIVLIFIQPDLGTTIVYLILWATIIWAAGLRIRHMLLLVATIVIIAPLGFSQLAGYQQARITTFLNADEADDADTFNIDQAIISIGSGGIFGKGYASGSQNTGRFLRVRHTDFIFSVIAHEFGIIGGIATMSLIGVVIMRILRGARIAADPMGSMICYGVAAMIFFQTTVSIGMNLNLMPVTGLTLPFVSSGGTSLLFTMIGIGLVQSVIVRRTR